ncbi:MAG: ribosomal-processing cysteine protease Prp [Lachnospiraceae bacterium]|nr:ribosomal-processing cysteine protease Prp [Lachnospiraceae bacterium]
MTIEFVKNAEGKLVEFHTKGHAEYDDPGFDIVCSAISALTINFVNSVDELTEDGFTYTEAEDGNSVDFVLKEDFSDNTRLLFDSYHLGIMQLEKTYGDYLQVIS